MIPLFLLPISQGFLLALVFKAFCYNEEALSVLNPMLILSSNIMIFLFHFFIFTFLERKRVNNNNKKILTLLIRSLCAISLSYTFLEGKRLLSEVPETCYKRTHSHNLSSQLILIFYFLTVELNFFYCGSAKLKAWVRGLALSFWFALELYFWTFENSELLFLISCFSILMIMNIFYGISQVKQEKSFINDFNLKSLLDRLGQGVLVLNKKKKLVYTNHTANIIFGLKKQNKDSIISSLLSQKFKTVLINEDNANTDNSLNKKDKRGVKDIAYKKILPSEKRIEELMDSPVPKQLFKKTVYFVELPCGSALDETKKVHFSNFPARVVETEEGRFANDFHFLEGPPKKIPFKLKLFRLNQEPCENGSELNYLQVLVFDNLAENNDILEEREGDRLKKNLLKSFSHEIHTALNGSMSMIDYAVEDQLLKKEFKQKYLFQTQICLKTLKYFLNDVIDYLKIETDEFFLVKEIISIADIFTEINYLMKAKCSAKGVGFSCHCIGLEEEEVLYTDPIKLKQILINLLSISLKYTFFGDIRLEFRESLKFTGCVELAVEDSRFYKSQASPEKKLLSIEMEEELEFRIFIAQKLARILCPQQSTMNFITAECSEKGVNYSFVLEKATSSTKKLINLMPLGSNIIKESLPRDELEGLDEIKLPLSKSSFLSLNLEFDEETGLTHHGQGVNRKIKPRSMLSLNSKNIISSEFARKEALIVDDDPFNILSMELILKKEGYVCHKAFNGLQALEFLKCYYGRPPAEGSGGAGISLIFMDLDMPEMDGLTCCKTINSLIGQLEIPFIPVVFCSANDTHSDLEACKLAGMSGFISKPLTSKKVRQILT